MATARMGLDEFCEMMDSLCELAIAECVYCNTRSEPQKTKGRWLHGRILCEAQDTHDRISALEAEYGEVKPDAN